MSVKRPPRAAKPPVLGTQSTSWASVAGVVATLIVALMVYGPALNGPFVLDDNYLPFGRPDAGTLGLAVWTAGRPLLGLSYYLNFLGAGQRPAAYHLTNVLLHAAVAWIVFIILRRAVSDHSPRTRLIAAIGAGVFLLHPLQTEAVAYVAGRSDVLSTLFAYAAVALFLQYRRPEISFTAVAGVLGLSLLALLSKQQAVAIPAVLILIDLLWHEESALKSVKRNIRLHAPLAVGAIAGAVWIFARLAQDNTAGWNVPGMSPLDYFFTQCRVFWHYTRLFLLPVGQNLDPDFAISHGPFDQGAILGLAGIAALIGLAFWLRRARPLSSAGILIFLVLLAPTSSFVPIADPVAERRMYFAMLGPLLILVDLLRTWRAPTQTLAIAGVLVLSVLGWATYSRAKLWGDEMALWRDTVAQSPKKLRPRFQLAHLLYRLQRCSEAAREYEAAAALTKPGVELLVDWGLALDCSGKSTEAVEKLREALAAERNYYSLAQLGMVLAKHGNSPEALPLLTEAIQVNSGLPAAFGYRGNVYATQGRLAEAEADFRRALTLDPEDRAALNGLRYVERVLGAPARPR